MAILPSKNVLKAYFDQLIFRTMKDVFQYFINKNFRDFKSFILKLRIMRFKEIK